MLSGSQQGLLTTRRFQVGPSATIIISQPGASVHSRTPQKAHFDVFLIFPVCRSNAVACVILAPAASKDKRNSGEPQVDPSKKLALSKLDERELVARAKTDNDAFGEIYDRYVERIYNYVYYRTSNHQVAEDLTARVFHRALQHIGRYEDRGAPFSAWLYRIAHNLVANYHRNRSRRTMVPLDDLIVSTVRAEAPERLAERIENQDELLTVIHTLPEDRQLLLVLKFVERLSNAEIGEVMGRSEGAIKSLYHRTLVYLRDEMAEIEHPPDRRTRGFGLRKPRRRDW